MLNSRKGLLYERLNSILNTSTTKQAYSFGKAIRFKILSTKDNSYKFYDLPDLKSKRGTILGYGKKGTISIVGCGSNQLYAAPSYFSQKKSNSGFTFGVSRPKKKDDELSPGPKYNCTNKFGKGSPGYIFGKSKRLKLFRSSSLPGPGSYYNEKNHELSKCFNSNLSNSVKIIIGREKRFLNLSKEQTPGPGNYNISGLINETGMIYNSKYQSVPARSFLSSRNKRRKKEYSPGPGQYKYFSIFEGYTTDKMEKNKN